MTYRLYKTIENIADMVLGNKDDPSLPGIAIQALEEGLVSDSLRILAGFSKHDNAFEMMDYYHKTFKELKINMPSEKEAIYILLKHYINLIAKREDDCTNMEDSEKPNKELKEKIIKEAQKYYDFFDENFSIVNEKF